MRLIKLLLLLSFCAIAPLAHAVTDATPLSVDPRIRVVPYNPNEVYRFLGHYTYQSSIEFGLDEEIKTISIGDSTAWQVAPVGNRIFLKPIQKDPQTNMLVITTKHTYNFVLNGKRTDNIDDKDMVFEMRFIYPGESDVSFQDKNKIPNPEIDIAPGKYNQNYSIAGNQRISPVRIFDDGEFTFFQFKDINADIPAFFMVDSEGREAIINYRTVGDYIVVERVTSRFTLRDGPDVVCVYNEAKPLELTDKEKKEVESNK